MLKKTKKFRDELQSNGAVAVLPTVKDEAGFSKMNILDPI